jgi:hypothetical protein
MVRSSTAYLDLFMGFLSAIATACGAQPQRPALAVPVISVGSELRCIADGPESLWCEPRSNFEADAFRESHHLEVGAPIAEVDFEFAYNIFVVRTQQGAVLGCSLRDDRCVLRPIALPSPAVHVMFECAATRTGAVYCWGSRLAPRRVGDLQPPLRALVTDGWSTCALDGHGRVLCWEFAGDLETLAGDPVPGERWTQPTALFEHAHQIVGGYSTCASVGDRRRLRCWSETHVNRERLRFEEEFGLEDVVVLVPYRYNMCAQAGGEVWCFEGTRVDSTFRNADPIVRRSTHRWGRTVERVRVLGAGERLISAGPEGMCVVGAEVHCTEEAQDLLDRLRSGALGR